MSTNMPSEPRIQVEVIDAGRGPPRCRIPQRLQQPRARPPSTTNSIPKQKGNNNMENSKQRYEVMSSPNTRYGAKNTPRPRSDESRPKSANRLKEELFPNRQASMRSSRLNDRTSIPPKRPAISSRKPFEIQGPPNKNTRPYIMVPLSQRPPAKPHKNPPLLPDQETIKKQEDLELRLSDQSDNVPLHNDCSEIETLASPSDKVIQLKISWQEKIIHFEKMKTDLKNQQNAILELYAVMRDTHQKISSLGEKVNLPSAENLRIMNVSKMTPDQLLQLCAGDDPNSLHYRPFNDEMPVAIDVKKIYAMPSKLESACDETLAKGKKVIDWFQSLISVKEGISVHKLTKKIKEFYAENEMLKCSLDQVKTEFLKELEEIIDMVRKSVNETMALQLRAEEMTYEISELNSQNADLRKQIQNSENVRSQSNKNRLEELEKELKEEKCKKLFLRDRMNRAEGQVKIHLERISKLETALDQAHSQNWSLERTVQQLHEQNQKLQNDFDKELNKLTESIRENTVHLEEIADAREKLQAEKEDLEKRLTELSLYYNEAHDNMKHEMNLNVAKLIEIEKKFDQEVEDKKKLEEKMEALCVQLQEAELDHKAVLTQLKEKEALQDELIDAQKELENAKRELEKSNKEIDNNRNMLIKQSEAIQEIERNFKEAVILEQSLKSELTTKGEYICELEQKQNILEQQLQENESKMESYVDQLSSLKIQINQLQEDFGEFENLNELHDLANQQRAKLLEATRQNGELAEALQKKDEEIERYIVNLSGHEQLLLEREGVIKMLSEKEEEHSNIIKIMRNNLELRTQADNELSQQIVEKNAEIDSLVVNLETKQQQITKMERVILTLEDQTRKASVQRKKDLEQITLLQKKIAEYEALHMEATRNMDTPAENLDSLIKILEEELGNSMEHESHFKEHNYQTARKKYVGDRKRETPECREDITTRYQSEADAVQNKIAMANYVKNNYVPNNEDQYIGDNLDRKKAITNIDTQKWIPAPEVGLNMHPPQPALKDNSTTVQRRLGPSGHQRPINFTRNLQYLNPDQLFEDKKSKMFKFAGHKL